MRAIILAAGQSKRLRPLTNEIPKCLLEINGRPIIENQINSLLKNNIKEIIVVTGWQRDKLEDYLKNNFPEANFCFLENKNYENTSPAYSLWLASKFLDQDAIYLNADVLFDPQIIANVINSPADSTTAIQKVAWDDEEVNIISDAENNLIEIGKNIDEKNSDGEFIGITKLGKEFNKKLLQVMSKLENDNKCIKFAADAINETITKGGNMKILDVTNLKAIEIDTVEDFEKAQIFWK